jgi:hypothetical protein
MKLVAITVRPFVVGLGGTTAAPPKMRSSSEKAFMHALALAEEKGIA